MSRSGLVCGAKRKTTMKDVQIAVMNALNEQAAPKPCFVECVEETNDNRNKMLNEEEGN